MTTREQVRRQHVAVLAEAAHLTVDKHRRFPRKGLGRYVEPVIHESWQYRINQGEQ